VVVPSDVGNFEGEGLCLDVGFLAKGYREVDLSQRESLIFRNDPVKEGLVLANLGKRDSHCIEGHGIQDAEAASSVHQHLREVHQTHDRGNNHLEHLRLQDVLRVVGPIEGDGRLGPSKES
jgi:hypothetical protein